MLYYELEDGLYTAGPYFFAKVRAGSEGWRALHTSQERVLRERSALQALEEVQRLASPQRGQGCAAERVLLWAARAKRGRGRCHQGVLVSLNSLASVCRTRLRRLCATQPLGLGGQGGFRLGGSGAHTSCLQGAQLWSLPAMAAWLRGQGQRSSLPPPLREEPLTP